VAGFVRSREWIGSFELSLCLDHLYQVPFRVASSLDHVHNGRFFGFSFASRSSISSYK
jgi:hypothetical protein